MRLFLSSYGLGDQPEKLAELVGASNKRVAVINNAADYKVTEERNERLDTELDWLSAIGLTGNELDLRDYFSQQDELHAELSNYGLVWVRGGNTFILKRAIEASGFEIVLKSLLADDSLVYGGYSAGACIATPTLHGIDLIDDPLIVPAGYSSDFSWQGMGLVDYSIAPHFRSNHPESELVEKTVEYFVDNSMSYKTLRDGEVITVNHL